jgi:large subunit ribosomal protein L29
MKKKEFNDKLKGVSKGDLIAQAKQISEELMKLRFRKASGQLEQAHQIPHIRKNLARVRSAINRSEIAANSK